jgi:P-type E1-E2 ATPase
LPQKKGLTLFCVVLAIAIGTAIATALDTRRKDRQFRDLQDQTAVKTMSTVIRNGQMKQIRTCELLVGDICYIEIGELIPADGLVIQASERFKVDESSLSGETNFIDKNPTNNPIVLSG